MGSLIPFGGRLHEIAERLAGKLLEIAAIIACMHACARIRARVVPRAGG